MSAQSSPVPDSLQEPIIHEFEQTPDGFLWVATHEGLNSYRKDQQQLFRNDPEDEWSLSGNHISVLFGDSKGRLWVGTTQNGLNLYDRIHHRFYHINNSQDYPEGLAAAGVSDIGEDTAGCIWVVTDYRNVDWFRAPEHLPDHPDLNASVKWVGHCTGNEVNEGSDCLQILKSNHFQIEHQPSVVKTPWWGGWRLVICILIVLTALGLFIYQLYRHSVLLKAQLQFEKETIGRMETVAQIKKQLLNNVVHEVRTPLTLILDPVRQLLKQEHDKTLKSKLQGVEKNSERLLALVNQLLDHSKIEDGLLKPAFRKADLIETIRQVYQSFFVAAHTKSLKMYFKTEGVIGAFYFDQQMVEKMVAQLLSNAVKYTPEGGLIELRITQFAPFEERHNSIHTSVVISVKDTGVGIVPEKLTRVFNLERLPENHFSGESAGMGIGLALVKGYVDLHGGNVEVESEPEVGSTFSIWLPCLPAPPENGTLLTIDAMSDDNKEEWMDEIRRSNNLVLVIERDTAMQLFIKEMLLARGHQVVVANNSEEGLEKIAKLIPDLLITELPAPTLAEKDLISAVRQNETVNDIPIIVVTAKLDMESKLKSVMSGADAFLTKPFYAEELIAYAEHLLKRRKRRIDTVRQEKEIPDLEEPLSDDNFLRTLSLEIEQHLSNEALGVQQLADALGVNRTYLYRKVKNLTDQSVLDFIRNYRLERARHLLEQRESSVNEVARLTGFPSSKHFSRVFKERFGVSPGSFKQGN